MKAGIVSNMISENKKALEFIIESKKALEFIIDTFNELAQKPQDIGLMFKIGEAHGKVKQALNLLETANRYNDHLIKTNIDLTNRNLELHQENEKRKKAIEVLKNYTDIEYLLTFESFKSQFTQQEYKLLKEVFGNDK